VAAYRERLTAPPSWWIGALIFGGVCSWIVVVAAGVIAGVIAGVVGVAVVAGLVAAYGNLTVSAGPDGLRVGAAHLTPEFIGAVTVLDGPAFGHLMGPDADARAYMRTRSYVTGGVRVDVDDPRDPVPYWLVSCRRPDAVAAALGHARD
jgi:hypothetical protein